MNTTLPKWIVMKMGKDKKNHMVSKKKKKSKLGKSRGKSR